MLLHPPQANAVRHAKRTPSATSIPGLSLGLKNDYAISSHSMDG